VSGRGRASPFVVPVGALRQRPGTRRQVLASGPLEDLSVSDSAVPPERDVVLDVVLESFSGGITVAGTVSAPWSGRCRRCLEEASGTLVASVREICSQNPDLDLDYALDGDWLDLEPVAHDACILELPLAPLCGPDCLGLCPTCGVNLNLTSCSCVESADPRWGALAALATPNLDRKSDDGRP